MPRRLLDVNLFLALLWPVHVHHRAAQSWFASEGHHSWATNPLTQLGLLRLLTNPAITKAIVTPAAAIRVLTEATDHPGHYFWALDRPAHVTLDVPGHLTGHGNGQTPYCWLMPGSTRGRWLPLTVVFTHWQATKAAGTC